MSSVLLDIQNVKKRKGKQKTIKTVNLGINQLIIADEPVVITTVLGSCVAVCLYDLHTRVGGMNHFMLPLCFAGKERDVLRYGDTAILRLIRKVRQRGAKHLKAKIFGGARVFPKGKAPDISRENVRIAHEILTTQQIEIVTSDVGGADGRVVRFFPYSGRAFVKRCSTAKISRLEEHKRNK